MENQKIIEKLTSEVLLKLPLENEELNTPIISYIKQYGKIRIDIKDRSFYCNGIDFIGGIVTNKNIKIVGVI